MMSLEKLTEYVNKRYMDSDLTTAQYIVCSHVVELIERGHPLAAVVTGLLLWYGMAIGDNAQAIREEIDTVLKAVQEG